VPVDRRSYIVTFTLTPTGGVEDAATLTWWTPSNGSWQPTNLHGANPAIADVQLAFDAAGHPHFLLATRNYNLEYFTFVAPSEAASRSPQASARCVTPSRVATVATRYHDESRPVFLLGRRSGLVQGRSRTRFTAATRWLAE
jgi:hypothetical protein